MNQRRFNKLWRRCMGADGESAFRRLESLYGEPHRRYHTEAHIEHCLRQFDLAMAAAPEGIPNADAVEMAVWFHDAIYVVDGSPAPDNEERSANLFLECAGGRGSERFRADVQRLIRVTDHRNPPEAADERYLVDIDLSSFGLPWPEFLLGSHDTRAEQPEQPDAEFYAGQKTFLCALLDRPEFCFTGFFRKRHENRARDNIRRYLALEKPLKPDVLPPAG